MTGTKKGLLKPVTIIILIISLLFCIPCKSLEGNRFYFVTSNNGIDTLNLQYVDSDSSIHFDLAGEETLRSITSSYSSFNQTLMRTWLGSNQTLFFLIFVLITGVLILTNTLRSYGCQLYQKQSFSSVRIAKFIEHSDGKK